MIESIDCEGMNTNGLRYKKPDHTGLDMADYLSEQELGVLCDHLEEDTPAWMQVATALVTTQMRLAGEESDDFGEDDDVEMAFADI